jgi:hypothetical protein
MQEYPRPSETSRVSFLVSKTAFRSTFGTHLGSDWDTLRSAWYRVFSTGVERSADAPDGFSSREGQVKKVFGGFGGDLPGDFP